MNRPVVAIPFRATNPIRAANHELTVQYYEELGFRVISSDSDPDQPFNVSQARNRAVALAEPWDVVVVADADTLLDRDPLEEAIDLAVQHGSLVRTIGALWLQREDRLTTDPRPLRRCAGGVHVWSRYAWQVLGGYDERFTGWSLEDVAVVMAGDTFGLTERVDGEAVHLFHEREPEWVDGLLDSYDGLLSEPPLLQRYRAALYQPPLMRALLDERLSAPTGADATAPNDAVD